MSKRKQYHVTPRKDGNWQVKESGSERASSVHKKKSEAVDRGREIAKNQHGQIVIHKSDGRIETEHTYGNDPSPPKG